MADGQIIIDTQVDSSGAEKDVKGLSGKLGSFTKTAAKTTAAMVTVATGAIAALAKLSVEQYAEYEQLTGGVETLFKKSSNKVMEYANNAYKTAGMSANEYMNTITGFAASLLQGLGGDTKKAAEIGNMAVTDMSDNANKMGTAIENIQNAYQGFAKQNYTMLDNLKLGYGGTKTEMQRLLADAQKISGVKYDIKNFNDVIEAIHVIQKNMGITGTTSLEAATTIEGSLNMTKAAWTNLLTGMADDQDNFDTLINNLVNSVGALGENLLPRIEIAINGVANLIDKLLPPIINKLPELMMSILPGMVNAGVNVVSALGIGILESFPTIIGLGLQILTTLGQGIAQNLPTLIPAIVNLIISMCDTIIENLPMLISVAIDIILALVQGLVTALPTLIAEVPRIINSFADAIYNALPQILLAGIEILMMLIKGLITSIPTLVANIPQIIMAIVNAVTLYNWAGLGKNLIDWIRAGIESREGIIGQTAKRVAEWVGTSITNIFKGGLSWGKNLISSIGQGISSMTSFLSSSARSLATNALTAIKTKFSEGFSIGKNLIEGIWNGISNMKQWILNKIGGFAGSIISGIKNFFDIHSPSRVMRDLIGVNLVRGIGVGIDVETPNLEKDIDANMSDLVAKMQSTVNYETSRTSARVSAHNNVLGDGDEGDTSSSKEKPIVVEAKFIVDGKEFTQTVVAPNQDVLTEYYEGR
ncbi:Phage-related protein [uncultured Clostridium sp.]|nr:Phage-related protein [uncultured Clostridium sp.]